MYRYWRAAYIFLMAKPKHSTNCRTLRGTLLSWVLNEELLRFTLMDSAHEKTNTAKEQVGAKQFSRQDNLRQKVDG